MSIEKIFRNIFSNNTALRGGVSPGKLGEDRVLSLVGHMFHKDFLTGSYELSQGLTSDWYDPSTHKTNGEVSIEEACDLEKDMKEALDDAVEGENVHSSGPGRVSGDVDAPCRVMKRRMGY